MLTWQGLENEEREDFMNRQLWIYENFLVKSSVIMLIDTDLVLSRL